MYGCESWLYRKLSTKALMLLNCGVGEESWESLGQQGDPISQSERKLVLNIHWKDCCWSWNSNALATDAKNWFISKDPDAEKDWRQEKETREDEMVGWHHRLDRHEFEKSPGVGSRQGSLACCSSWGHKETLLSNWTELNWFSSKPPSHPG